jgi:hypothetical protein
MARWIDHARDAWELVFAAAFVLSIIAGAIQHFRGRELWESPMLPVIAALHFLWVLPFILPILALWLAYTGVRWIWRWVSQK